jgi:hypothetical protein
VNTVGRSPFWLLPWYCKLLSLTQEVSMDPLTSRVTALAAGAAVTLHATVAQASQTATPPCTSG